MVLPQNRVCCVYSACRSILPLPLEQPQIVAAAQHSFVIFQALKKMALGQLLGIWFREIGKQIGLRAATATTTTTARWRSPLEIALMQLL